MSPSTNRGRSELETLQRIQAAVVIHRADTSIVMCNRAAQSLLGLTEDQMLGKTALDPAWRFVSEDGSTMPLDAYPVNQVIATGAPLRNLILGISRPAARDTLWVLVHADPAWEDGKLCEVVVTFMDITERKRAQEALKETEERMRRFFDAAFEGIAITQEGRLIDFNPQFSATIGYERAELVGKPIIELVAEEDRGKVLEHIQSGFDRPYEHRAVRKDGTVIFLEVHGKQISYQGRPARVTAIHDLTARKRAEEALRIERDRLRVALTEVDTLRGILPICSFCKKIRDDEGFWNQVDVYFRDHSLVDFSHSICPPCIEEHYPELRERKSRNGP